MLTNEPEKLTCIKCLKKMDATKNFYTYKDGTKLEICKRCLTMHVDNNDPTTFMWILQKMDLPYIPSEWRPLLDKAIASGKPVNGTSVLGKYISKMKLKQWKDFTWADTDALVAEDEERMKAKEKERIKMTEEAKRMLENGEITENQYRTLIVTEDAVREQNTKDIIMNSLNSAQQFSQQGFFNEDNYLKEEELIDLGADLTEDDKKQLAMKWGRLFTPHEWVQLEQKYKEMMESFDIHDSDSIGNLIIICKLYLKMNQALDTGDYSAFKSLSYSYDQLRKSSKFTAVQNKEEEKDFVDCVGELIAYCEKEGGKIPEHKITVPYDIVDEIINDMKSYTRTLINEDKSLAQQIETYLLKRENVLQQKRDKDEAKKKGLNEVELSDQDMLEHYERQQKERELDEKLYANYIGEDDEL